ncbi:hypothetical protein G7054_g6360 [Neopestalotiopsis clavispora]|nr:hypothetical protein E8E14_007274 [Neopestalotiopsis sp. 37M]KAF7534288.1 hypothetical protein G7054_g6360 [Neopestalotiopsis clavispora]
MVSFSKTATVAAVALVQVTSAGFLALIPEAVVAGIGAASGVVSAAGTVTGLVLNNTKARAVPRSRAFRRAEANQAAWDSCHDQLGSASLHFSSPQGSDVLVEGVPSSCMTLATVITGKYNAGNPIPEGSDSILFQNMSDDDLQALQNALNSRT